METIEDIVKKLDINDIPPLFNENNFVGGYFRGRNNLWFDLKQSIIKDVEKLIADTEGDHEAYEWFIIEYLNKKFNIDDRDVKINGVYIKCQKN